MRALLLLSFTFVEILSTGCHAADGEFSGERYLDNGAIRIGVDLSIGGAITYLAESDGGQNLINSHDWGRQVQMSFYSGPVPFEPGGKKPRESWRFLGWNPIQSGDCYNNRSKVIDYSNDGETLYVKCIPMQWPLDNEPGECTFETWITLEGAVAQVRSKIVNDRVDETQYPARGQELPAVYTNGTHWRLFTYDGDAPFTKGPLRQITKVWDTSKGPQVEGGPWDHWYATENWAALVDTEDFGVGVHSPGTFSFVGGFAGQPGAGGPKDAPTGYIAPTRREILDHDIAYGYDYSLIVGSLDAIREAVYGMAGEHSLPHFTFEEDRQSWTLRNARDAGWPLNGRWEVSLEDASAVLVGPDVLWDSRDAPTVVIRAGFDTAEAFPELRWESLAADGASGSGQVRFEVIPDGVVRRYVVRLAGSDDYRGMIKRLSIAPRAKDLSAKRVVVEGIEILPE